MTATDQSAVLKALQKAHGRVLDVPRYLLPKEGITLAYAVQDPRSAKDVAVVRGSGAGFGVDEHIVRILLTTTRFDPDVRAAGIIRYTEEIGEVVRETLRDVAEYDPLKFPPGISSMDWGIASCVRNGAPLAIMSSGTRENPPVIRLLGTTPDEVANRILIIAERLTYIDI